MKVVIYERETRNVLSFADGPRELFNWDQNGAQVAAELDEFPEGHDRPGALRFTEAGTFERRTDTGATRDVIDAERDRRIAAGFPFLGHWFECDPESKQNISGAASLALGAIAQGVAPGVLDWTGSGADFAWLSADNVAVPMDAQTVFAFGAVAAEHVRAHIFAARALKDAAAPVLDETADHHWPEVTL